MVVSIRGDYQEGEEFEIFPLLICFFAYFLVNTRKYGSALSYRLHNPDDVGQNLSIIAQHMVNPLIFIDPDGI